MEKPLVGKAATDASYRAVLTGGMSVSRISLKNSRGLIPMSHPILGSFIAVAALLLLGSAYLMADDSAACASLLAVVGVGILLSGVRVIRRRHLG
jgi:hypothetical protein